MMSFSELPIVDATTLAKLREDTGDEDGELVEELVGVFADEMASSVQQLVASVKAGDHEGLASIAHRLKSGSANLGTARLAALCTALETAGRAQEDTTELAAMIEPISQAAVAGLREYLSSIGRGLQQAAGQ